MSKRTTTTTARGAAGTSRDEEVGASKGTAAAASSPAADQATASATGKADEPAEPRPASPAARAARAGTTKIGRIRTMLAAPGGASLPALCEATGWQTHSVRAALTGLRKAGTSVEKGKGEDGVTVYRLGAAAGTGETGGEGEKARAGGEALT